MPRYAMFLKWDGEEEREVGRLREARSPKEAVRVACEENDLLLMDAEFSRRSRVAGEGQQGYLAAYAVVTRS